jgi:hypothetical protein
MGDIFHSARRKVIQDNNFVTIGQEPIYQMTANKAGSASDQCSIGCVQCFVLLTFQVSFATTPDCAANEQYITSPPTADGMVLIVLNVPFYCKAARGGEVGSAGRIPALGQARRSRSQERKNVWHTPALSIACEKYQLALSSLTCACHMLPRIEGIELYTTTYPKMEFDP